MHYKCELLHHQNHEIWQEIKHGGHNDNLTKAFQLDAESHQA